MLFGALTLTVSTVVTSCKDYDDDIKGLQEQVDKIKMCIRDRFYRTGRFYVPFLADIEMIPRSVESPSAMTDVQVIFCETLIFARSGALDYYQIYSSHGWIK